MRKLLLLLAAGVMLVLGAQTQARAQGRGEGRPQPPRSQVIEATVKSDLLGVEKPYLIYLPAEYEAEPDRKFPVLYLLHGASDTHTAWLEKGNMKLITDEYLESGMALPMIVVMPDARGQAANFTGKNMGYFNQPDWPYEDHFFTEFIPYIEKTYRIIGDRKHRAIAGLSMGGGGTVGYAQKHPEMFSSACPLSGALAGMGSNRATGSHIKFVEDATPEQLASLRSVRWWVDCGDGDSLWKANIDFFRAMKEKGIPVQMRMRNGAHNWKYWQGSLPEVLTFVSIGFSE